ncbi:WYL domain-containing protein [Erythrobacter sp. KY5]|nr:WYL domain-containing protein [Erythrobacter sp. KY5]
MSFSKAVDLLRLAMLATRRTGISLEEIVEEFECHYRTAQRWTDALMETFPQAYFEDLDDRKRRWFMPPSVLAPLLTPSPEELAALNLAILNFDQDGQSEQKRTLTNLQQKIQALTPPDSRARLAVDQEILLEAVGYAARPGPRPVADAKIDEAISEALKGPFRLRAIYRRRQAESPRERVLEPYGVLLGTRRYLVARDVKKGRNAPFQHYRIEAFLEAEALPETFIADPNFELTAHAQKGFGSYESADEFGDVVWRFSPAAADHAARFVFHPTQETERESDGSLLVRFRASGHLEMCWFLYAWGQEVQVLQPPALRELVHDFRRDFPALP